MKIMVLLMSLTVGVIVACPVAYHTDIGGILKDIGQQGTTNIYFCQQNFSSSTRKTSIAPTELSPMLTGGTYSNAFTSVTKVEDLTVSCTELSSSIPDFNLDQVTRIFPLSGTGQYGKSSIFNFYTRVKPRGLIRSNTCYSGYGGNQYDLITTFLRNNASMFQASTPSTGTRTAVASYAGNMVAVINNLRLENSMGDTMRADLYFEHANPTSGQYFTSKPT